MSKKKIIVLASTALALVLALTIGIVVTQNNKPKHAEKLKEDTSPVSSDVNIEKPDIEETNTSSQEDVVELQNDGTGLKPSEEGLKNTEPEKGNSTASKIENIAKPIKPYVPEDNKGGIEIPGEKPPEYSCGVEGHHCDGPETHAYILNLEKEGCPYCGSHKCPSFYATNEWGNARYTPSKCPKYDEKKDPVYYCHKCGKPTGDGTNGTCATYVEACECPNCGKHIDGWSCHSCE